MSRLALVLAAAMLSAACSGLSLAAPMGDQNSEARLSFDAGATETSGRLLAFDPAQHSSLDISISMPLAQHDDLDVYIVTSRGIRFQVLESFSDCQVDDESRMCDRWLPVLPDEGLDDWRVEAVRTDSQNASSLRVDVTWVRLATDHG